jgi:hypothetical protein
LVERKNSQKKSHGLWPGKLKKQNNYSCPPPTKFWFIWQSNSRGDTRISCGGHVCFPIWIKWGNFIQNFP